VGTESQKSFQRLAEAMTEFAKIHWLSAVHCLHCGKCREVLRISGIPLVEHVNSMYRGAWKGLSMACQWGALGRIGQLPRSTIFFSDLSNRPASDMTVLLTIAYGGLSWVAKSGNVAVSGKVSYLAKKDR
jgi:hypothetical protein